MVQVIRKTTVFLVSALLMLGVMELFLRGTEIQLPGVTRYDGISGMSLKENRRLVSFNEGFYLGGTNGYGYYGEPYPPRKPEGAVRLALMGDSHVEGHQLFERDHFGTVLEKELGRLTGLDIEVMNFGMTGYNLSDAYCYSATFASKFHPDITLFFIDPGDLDSSPRRRFRPNCYIKNDSLKIDRSFSRSPVFQARLKSSFVRGQSSVLNLISHAREVASKGFAPQIIFGKFVAPKPQVDRDFSSLSSSETTLRIIHELLQREDVYLVLNEHMTEDMLEEFAKAPDRIIYLRDCLDRVDGNPRYWVATDKLGHWNREAHRAIGEYIASILASRLND